MYYVHGLENIVKVSILSKPTIDSVQSKSRSLQDLFYRCRQGNPKIYMEK